MHTFLLQGRGICEIVTAKGFLLTLSLIRVPFLPLGRPWRKLNSSDGSELTFHVNVKVMRALCSTLPQMMATS